ncbi:Npun_R2821/Npun_R2822 family protein [Prochlorothrix hollandica]|uniref:Npun_R2821/Npun_R2822 family protein n=1 Tax=Prochlorothrix hollandica TaxID=1223 RepID=UPI00334109A7
MDGICTLANDAIYDQLVALLNSIEVHAPGMPVCVYPYNDQVERITAAIADRPQVQLYDDRDSLDRWEDFFRQVETARQQWDSHTPAADKDQIRGNSRYHRFRRFAAFDGPFDRFLYLDGDTLLLKEVSGIFAALDQADWVVYDFQHKDPGHVYQVQSPRLRQRFSPDRLATEIFCSGFYATRRHLFSDQQLASLAQALAEGDAELLHPTAVDQPILNYMAMASNLNICNLALTLPADQITGCCVTSPHFRPQPLSGSPDPTVPGPVLYDKNNRLTYLHYIGLSSRLFARLCQGENLDFPYRDIFLDYRYLKTPHDRPILQGKPRLSHQPPNLFKRALRKLKLSR